MSAHPPAVPVPIAFDDMPWQSTASGVRYKSVTRSGQQLRLVEFSAGFVEPHWCAKGHVGWVLDGAFELEHPGGTTVYSAGQGVFLQAGLEEKHKVRVTGERALLVLVEAE